jgi:hypothetical protein
MSSAHDSSAGNEPIGNYEERFARKIAAVVKPSARASGQGSGNAGKFGGGGALVVVVYIVIRVVATGLSHSSRTNDTPTYSPPVRNVDFGQIQRDAETQRRLQGQGQRQGQFCEPMDRFRQPQPPQPQRPDLGPPARDGVPREGLPGKRPGDDLNRGGLPGRLPGGDFHPGDDP